MTRTKRRRTLRMTGLVVVGACALLAACNDGPVAAPDSPKAAPLSDPLAQKVADMGFRVDMIVDRGDHFLVEGDIVISKADLLGPTASPRTGSQPGPVFQWHTNQVVAQAKMAQGLRVDISGISSNSGWVTAVRDAMTQYRWTWGTKIHLVEGSPADITVTFNEYLGSYIAVASWPTNGVPGGTIEINPSFNSLSSSKKLWTMVHEIGHTIGYRHSNWDDLNEETAPEHYTLGANFIPGTLYSDPNSVMVGGQGAKSWNGFSQYDATANRYLYPGPAPSYTYQGYNAANHPHLEWSSVSEATSYHVNFVYYVEEFVYDPGYPGGGYYTWVRQEADLGYVTGTSFTDTNAVYTGNDCGASYEVSPVFPSGKRGAAAGSDGFLIC